MRYVSRIRVKQTKVAYVPNTDAKSYLDKCILYSLEDGQIRGRYKI